MWIVVKLNSLLCIQTIKIWSSCVSGQHPRHFIGIIEDWLRRPTRTLLTSIVIAYKETKTLRKRDENKLKFPLKRRRCFMAFTALSNKPPQWEQLEEPKHSCLSREAVNTLTFRQLQSFKQYSCKNIVL